MSLEKKTPPLFEVDGKSLLANINTENVARYVILAVRDPLWYSVDVAHVIAEYMEDATLVGDTGLFVTYTGTYKRVPITVMSLGSGAPEAELAMVEFLKYTKADTFIRAGTSGTYLDDVNVGDIVIAAGAVRDEGTSQAFVPPTYPAVSDYQVTLALIEAAEKNEIPYHVGITRSTDSATVGQGRPVLDYFQEDTSRIPEYWRKAGVKNFERETSIMLVMGTLFGKRSGAVNAVVNSTPTGILEVGAGADSTFRTILDGIVIMAEWDKTKEEKGKKYWFPSLNK